MGVLFSILADQLLGALGGRQGVVGGHWVKISKIPTYSGQGLQRKKWSPRGPGGSQGVGGPNPLSHFLGHTWKSSKSDEKK